MHEIDNGKFRPTILGALQPPSRNFPCNVTKCNRSIELLAMEKSMRAFVLTQIRHHLRTSPGNACKLVNRYRILGIEISKVIDFCERITVILLYSLGP